MKQYALLLFLSMLSCNEYNFYNYTREFDVFRLPLVEPYEIVSVGTGTVWGLRSLKRDRSTLNFSFPVDSVTVACDTIIFLRDHHTKISEVHISKPCIMVIDVKAESMHRYTSIEEMTLAFPDHKVNFKSADAVFNRFRNKPSKEKLSSLLCQ